MGYHLVSLPEVNSAHAQVGFPSLAVFKDCLIYEACLLCHVIFAYGIFALLAKGHDFLDVHIVYQL